MGLPSHGSFITWTGKARPKDLVGLKSNGLGKKGSWVGPHFLSPPPWGAPASNDVKINQPVQWGHLSLLFRNHPLTFLLLVLPSSDDQGPCQLLH